MKKIILILIIFVFHITCFASNEKHYLTIKIQNVTDVTLKKAILYALNGENTNTIDSVKVNSDNTFVIPLPTKVQTGVYKIMIDNYYILNFVLTNSETNSTITTDFKDLKNNLTPLCNKENEAYGRIMQIVYNFKFKSSAITKSRRLLNDKATFTEEGLKNYIVQNNELRNIHNQNLDEVKTHYPNTYAANVLANLLYEPIIPDYKYDLSYFANEELYVQNHFFDTWDFKNENIINNQIISDRIHFLITRCILPNYTAYERVVDIIMAKASSNENVKEFILLNLIKTFYRIGPVEIVIYLNDKYVEGCSTFPIKPEMLKVLSDMKSVLVGSKAPNLVMNNPEGNEIKLSSLLGKSYVLVLFWASSCTHCQTEVPEIYKTYEEYKDKGLKVFSVSLDDSKDRWVNFINNNKLNWENACDYKKYKSEQTKKFFIYRTPSMLLLDKDGIIVSKNFNYVDLPTELKKLFK